MNLRYELSFQLKKLYWFIFRPQTYGVKCILVNQDKILMIKKTFGSSKWVFPGGAIRTGEDKESAARREIKEDISIELKELKYLGSFTQNVHYRRETIHCFASEISLESIDLDRKKIEGAKWVERSKLSDLTPISASVIRLYNKSLSTNQTF